MFILELAVVSLLLDELGVVVLAVEPPLMSNVVGRTYRATSMAALEAALVVRCSVDRDLTKMARMYVRITIDIQQKWYLLKYILFDRGHVLFQWDTPFSCIRHISLWCQRMRLKPCLLHSGDSQQYFSVRGECSKNNNNNNN